MNNFWKMSEEANGEFSGAMEGKLNLYELKELQDNLKKIIEFACKNPLPGKDPAAYHTTFPDVDNENGGQDLKATLIPMNELEAYFRNYRRWKIKNGILGKMGGHAY
jgi:hypothetical protein